VSVPNTESGKSGVENPLKNLKVQEKKKPGISRAFPERLSGHYE
jgi:hypothetical protein